MSDLLQKLTCFLFLIVFVSSFQSNEALASDQEYREAIKKAEEAYKDAKWDNLSIEFRRVEEVKTEGFTEMEEKNEFGPKGKKYYVSPAMEMDIRDIHTIDTFFDPMWNQPGITITLKKQSAEKFRKYTKNNIGSKIGVVIDGELRLVVGIQEEITKGKVQIPGLLPGESEDIAKRFYEPLHDAAPMLP